MSFASRVIAPDVSAYLWRSVFVGKKIIIIISNFSERCSCYLKEPCKLFFSSRFIGPSFLRVSSNVNIFVFQVFLRRDTSVCNFICQKCPSTAPEAHRRVSLLSHRWHMAWWACSWYPRYPGEGSCNQQDLTSHTMIKPVE